MNEFETLIKIPTSCISIGLAAAAAEKNCESTPKNGQLSVFELKADVYCVQRRLPIGFISFIFKVLTFIELKRNKIK